MWLEKWLEELEQRIGSVLHNEEGLERQMEIPICLSKTTAPPCQTTVPELSAQLKATPTGELLYVSRIDSAVP